MSSKASRRRPRLNSYHSIVSGGKITRVRAVMCANRRSHTGPQMSKKKEDRVPSTVRGAGGQIQQLPPHTPLDGLAVSLSPCVSPPTFHHPGHPSHAVNLLSSLSLLPFLSFLAAPVHPTPPPQSPPPLTPPLSDTSCGLEGALCLVTMQTCVFPLLRRKGKVFFIRGLCLRCHGYVFAALFSHTAYHPTAAHHFFRLSFVPSAHPPPPNPPFSLTHTSAWKIDLIKNEKDYLKRISGIMKTYYCIPWSSACGRRRRRHWLQSCVVRLGGVCVCVCGRGSPCFPLPPFIISLIVSPLSVVIFPHSHNIPLSSGFLIFRPLFSFPLAARPHFVPPYLGRESFTACAATSRYHYDCVQSNSRTLPTIKDIYCVFFFSLCLCVPVADESNVGSLAGPIHGERWIITETALFSS